MENLIRDAPDEAYCMDVTWLETPELPGLLAKYRGKPLLLNHWATWCDPCLEELPLLGRLHGEYGDTVAFVGLSWDRFEHFHTEDGTIDAIRKAGEDFGFDYPSLVFRGHPEELFEGLSLEQRVIPQTVLYDSAGNQVFFHCGSLEEPGIPEALRKALSGLTTTS